MLNARSAESAAANVGKKMPDSILEVVPEGPHSMYWERPDLFNAAVDRFLEALS